MLHNPTNLSFLLETSGFSKIGQEPLKQILDQSTTHHYAPGDYLFRRGEMGETMHVIREGMVRILIDDDSVIRLGEKNIIGEMALLTHEPRIADVIAETDVVTLAFNHTTLDPLLHKYPELARFLTEILAERLGKDSGIRHVGKYNLTERLGGGTTSKVYEGIHRDLGHAVAVKMLNHALVYDDLFSKRFIREAQTIAMLNHPNIVNVYDVESFFGTMFIIMEKVSGPDLRTLLKRRKKIPPEETMALLHPIASALAFAHKKEILHRDVKPANCAVSDNGQVKLMDFGLSYTIPESRQQPRRIEGSPTYLAPEVIRSGRFDQRADIYALGVMALEMVTGDNPFRAKQIRDVLRAQINKTVPDMTQQSPNLPEGLARFINKALKKNPDERISDWPKILQMLTPIAPISSKHPWRPGIPLSPTLSHLSHEDSCLPSVDRITHLLQISYPKQSAREVQSVLRQLEAMDGVLTNILNPS